MRSLHLNPVFRHELLRPGRWRWALALAAGNSLYAAAFAGAHAVWQSGTRATGQGYSMGFDYVPWLIAGACSLSLCSHWLVPPFVLLLRRTRYELRTLTLPVREGVTEEESLRAQVAASVAPLALGVLPFLLLAVVLAGANPKQGLLVAGALAGGILWGSFCTTISLWAGLTFPRPPLAHACAYGLTSFVFPLALAGLSTAVGAGCSAGHAQREFVFAAAGTLTWGLLVTGLAAVFWDLALGQVFPERRCGLREDVPDSEPLES